MLPFLESTGGPFIGISSNFVKEWQGIEPSCAEKSHYEQACEVEGWIELRKTFPPAVIFWGMPLPMTAFKIEGGLLLIRVIAAENDQAIEQAVAAFQMPATAHSITITNVLDLTIFDSAEAGVSAGAKIVYPGEYKRITILTTTEEFRHGSTALIVHKIEGH